MKIIGTVSTPILTGNRLPVNVQKIFNALRRNVLNDRHTVSPSDTNVIPPFWFHLGQYGAFGGVQINALSNPGQTVIVAGFLEPLHKTRHVLPPWIDAQMADHLLFVL